NLQLPAAAGESAKIEIPELPSFDTKLGIIDLPSSSKQSNHSTSNNTTTTTTTDSYLSAIVSSSTSPSSTTPTTPPSTTSNITNTGSCIGTSDCTCYKCQRQKRRARGTNKTSPELTKKRSILSLRSSSSSSSPPQPQPQPQQQQQKVSPTVAIISKNVQQSNTSKLITTPRSDSLPPKTSTIKTNPTTTTKTIKKNNSICRRKTPSVKSYDIHLPRPTYSAQDSIYHALPQQQQQSTLLKSESHSSSDQSSIMTHTTSTTTTYQDNYEISWKDETTGDDLLNSLKTFQHIFEKQPTESVTGLSDLLEVGAHEIKKQRQEQVMYQKVNQQQQLEQLEMEPSQGQIYTLKHRHGPTHRALTLYHTMKMKDSKERLAAYGTAFNHCMRANSGLSGFIKRQLNKRGEVPKVLQDYTPRQSKRSTTKKSILRPIIPGKKKTTTDDMWHKISSSENPASALPPNNPWNKHQEEDSNGITPTDVLSAAHALLPNQSPIALHDSLSRTNMNTTTKPYDHVDTPSKPIPNVYNNVIKLERRSERDTSSISSMSVDGDSSSKTNKSGKLFSSFGKKPSRSRSGTISSTQSRSDSIKKMQRVNSKGSRH
ncbi:hypothetical protein INT45_006229, partial [Circinella minor]